VQGRAAPHAFVSLHHRQAERMNAIWACRSNQQGKEGAAINDCYKQKYN
jgi:hypothetical protein